MPLRLLLASPQRQTDPPLLVGYWRLFRCVSFVEPDVKGVLLDLP